MPEITVSDGLYRQLEAASLGKSQEETLWAMVYQFNRRNSPSE
ncbi:MULTISPECIES: hypothetical protein [Haloarcula]|jgi:hypothetical protein|nr:MULTISPECIES: hypothetical protein [unclassified Halomicroarcula]